MTEIIIYTGITLTAFIVFLIILSIGLIKRKRRTIFAALVVMIIFIISGIRTTYLFTNKSYHRLADIFRPRTGIEIYHALFGKPKNDCVEILNFQDQLIPKIDYAIWLHFKTCPEELNRILSLHLFKTEIVATKDIEMNGPHANENWFKPETLGDSMLTFTFNRDSYGNGQYVYTSLDSTIVFCKDVAD